MVSSGRHRCPQPSVSCQVDVALSSRVAVPCCVRMLCAYVVYVCGVCEHVTAGPLPLAGDQSEPDRVEV